MTTKFLNKLKTLTLIMVFTVITSLIPNLPWWTFLIPIGLIGIFVNIKQWQIRTFWLGFLAGFIIWFAANYYFDATSNGLVLSKVGNLLFVPKIVVLIISGIIGGLCSGLALTAGKLVFVINTDTNQK